MEPGPGEVGHEGRCNAVKHQRADGARCRKTAGWGTDHPGIGACKLHGGSTPAHVVRAERIRLAESIGELVAEVAPEAAGVDPTEGILEVVAKTWARKRALEMLVDQLVPRGARAYVFDEDPEDGRTVFAPAGEAGIFGPDSKGDAKPHVLVGMLHTETELHLKACKLAIDAGIEQRRIELAEGQAQQLADVLRTGMAGLLEAVRALGVLEGAALRQLEDQVPGLLRSAIERARVIDVPSDPGSGPGTPEEGDE